MLPEIIETVLEEISASSNKEELACDNQSGDENDMLANNKSDEQHITIEGKYGKENDMGIVKEKINTELQNEDEEEYSSKDKSSSSSLEEEDPITQEEEFKNQ
eukprot:7799094-Ditylum_brightwellii.AAC.1